MAEFEEKLGAILNDPQAMGQIMALAQSLGGKASQNSEKSSVSATSSPVFPPSAPAPSPPLPGQGQTEQYVPVIFENEEESVENQPFSGLNVDPKLLAMGMKAISAYQDPNNEKALLLQALRPFVKEERYKKVDKAVQISRISKAIRAVFDGFKGGEGGV